MSEEKAKDYSHLDNTTIRWYVMIHKNPQKLDLMLKRENATYRSTPGDMRQIEYFIPFSFLSRVHETGNATVVQAASFANQLREDFHDFAFFHTTERGIAELLDRPWNAGLRYRLRHFRDLHRHAVVISDAEMNTLLRVFSERKLKYTIGLPVADPSPDMTVSITANGPFNGQTARVIAVKHMPDGISLTLGVTLFQGVREIKLPDFRLSDIHLERNTEDIIGWTFIQTVEATLLDILSRRINHKETDESRQQDSDTLNRLFLYSYINISDPAVSAYFLALMLICSHLRFDKDSTTALAEKAKLLVQGSWFFAEQSGRAERKVQDSEPMANGQKPARPKGALARARTARSAQRDACQSKNSPQPSDISQLPTFNCQLSARPEGTLSQSEATERNISPQAAASLCLSLYIATRDANYRTMGKQIVQQLKALSPPPSALSPQPSALRRLMSLASKLRSKRSRN